jgi:hypothetical protein
VSALIEVDDQTNRALEFAARMSNTTTGQVVARLVEQASMPQPVVTVADARSSTGSVAVYADYEGRRTRAEYDPTTSRVDIRSGPLLGRSFKTPSAAARAVVGHYKPGVNPNRNGWSFWTLDDGSGRLLHSIR